MEFSFSLRGIKLTQRTTIFVSYMQLVSPFHWTQNVQCIISSMVKEVVASVV
jgi:hypothetical protein